jgi:hypothetical protein
MRELHFESAQEMYDHDVRVHRARFAGEVEHAPCPWCTADITFRVPFLPCSDDDDRLIGSCDCTGTTYHLDGDVVQECGEPCA